MAGTYSRHPLKLVYVEYFGHYTDARRRELFFKTGVGRSFIKARVAKWQTLRLWRKNPQPMDLLWKFDPSPLPM